MPTFGTRCRQSAQEHPFTTTADPNNLQGKQLADPNNLQGKQLAVYDLVKHHMKSEDQNPLIDNIRDCWHRKAVPHTLPLYNKVCRCANRGCFIQCPWSNYTLPSLFTH